MLRLTQAPEALDPAPAYPGRLVPHVPFQGVRTAARWEARRDLKAFAASGARTTSYRILAKYSQSGNQSIRCGLTVGST